MCLCVEGFRFWHHTNVGYNNRTCLEKNTAHSNTHTNNNNSKKKYIYLCFFSLLKFTQQSNLIFHFHRVGTYILHERKNNISAMLIDLTSSSCASLLSHTEKNQTFEKYDKFDFDIRIEK